MSVTESFCVNLKHLWFPSVPSTKVSLAGWEGMGLCSRQRLCNPWAWTARMWGARKITVSAVQYLDPCFWKQRCGVVRHSVCFFTIVANIYADRAVNDEVVFLSSINHLRDWYPVEQLGFLGEGSVGSLGILPAATAVLLYVFAAQRLHCSPQSLPTQFSQCWNGLSQVRGFFGFLSNGTNYSAEWEC